MFPVTVFIKAVQYRMYIRFVMSASVYKRTK